MSAADDAQHAQALADVDQRNACIRDGVLQLVGYLHEHDSGCDHPECGQAQLELNLAKNIGDHPDVLIELLASAVRMLHNNSVVIGAMAETIEAMQKETPQC